MKNCTVDMVVNTSHEIDTIGYHCGNKYQIIDDDKAVTLYKSNITFSDDAPEECINFEFEKEARIASLAMSLNEQNPTEGCPYLTINWESLKIELIADKPQGMNFSDKVNMRESFGMVVTRNIKLSKIKELIKHKENYHFGIEMFYYGLMSNNAKSKFFNFFTIIESLEGSEAYRKKYDNDFLFSEEEKRDIKLLLKNYEERKKKRLFSILDYTTLLSRAEKLYQHLQLLNLDCVNTGRIGIDDIKNIVEQRNRLYHSSKKFDSHLLYGVLFPLVRELVTKQFLNETEMLR